MVRVAVLGASARLRSAEASTELASPDPPGVVLAYRPTAARTVIRSAGYLCSAGPVSLRRLTDRHGSALSLDDLEEVAKVFFKSRMERDIDRFKTMQDKGTHVAQRVERVETQDSSLASQVPAKPAEMTEDQALGGTAQAPANREVDSQQTVVGANTKLEGKVRTEGSAKIEGYVSGDIEAGETVFIHEGATVRANIHARRVIIGGDAEGHIDCREELVVERSGRLGGRVSTRSLVIEEGAIVHSQIEMVADGESPPAVVQQTEPSSHGESVAHWA
jgi:cytoskeletal protein CcmA (bactofilin family)